MSQRRESELLKAHPRAKALLAKGLHPSAPQLDLAALAVCALEDPDVDVRHAQWTLDALGVRVSSSLTDSQGALEGLQALRQVLGEEEGFAGKKHDLSDPEDSLLHRVLQRRSGLPIALSVVYLEVARRVGIPLYGVSFPGHFVVAADVGQGKVILDPFHGGRLLSESGCESLLKKVAPQLRFTPSMIVPATPQTIAFRMLNNLKRGYLAAGDGVRALRVVDLMLQIAPNHPGELRARATILSTLGAYREALADIERCLQLSPDAPDHQSLQITAKALRQRVQFPN